MAELELLEGHQAEALADYRFVVNGIPAGIAGRYRPVDYYPVKPPAENRWSVLWRAGKWHPFFGDDGLYVSCNLYAIQEGSYSAARASRPRLVRWR